MSTRHSETKRMLAETTRQAKVATSSAAAACGPQAPGHIAAGEMQGNVFVPYGRVGITEPKNGFLPRRTG